MEGKELATEMLMKAEQVESITYPRLNFYVVFKPATLLDMNELKGIPFLFRSLVAE